MKVHRRRRDANLGELLIALEAEHAVLVDIHTVLVDIHTVLGDIRDNLQALRDDVDQLADPHGGDR